jgi:5-methyltetrahydrofolate--homocysteine methyltransferase
MREDSMELAQLREAVIAGDMARTKTLTEEALGMGIEPALILNDALISGMDRIGELFKVNEIYVPEVLLAAKSMQKAMEALKPRLVDSGIEPRGRIVVGTVRGDLHDIGKNLVAMMLEGAGFVVTDLGVDVTPETFVQKTQEVEPDILALSALLSTTMPAMPQTIEALQKAGLRDSCKVMIGGAPVTAKYAQEIGADSYAPDAGSAVGEAKKLLGVS